nr:hypothetical protein [Anaerococcus prevotii]
MPLTALLPFLTVAGLETTVAFPDEPVPLLVFCSDGLPIEPLGSLVFFSNTHVPTKFSSALSIVASVLS